MWICGEIKVDKAKEYEVSWSRVTVFAKNVRDWYGAFRELAYSEKSKGTEGSTQINSMNGEAKNEQSILFFFRKRFFRLRF